LRKVFFPTKPGHGFKFFIQKFPEDFDVSEPAV
jgi:hypothetical protein